MFDTGRFRRSIERAHDEMFDIRRRGEPGRSFDLPADQAQPPETHRGAYRRGCVFLSFRLDPTARVDVKAADRCGIFSRTGGRVAEGGGLLNRYTL